MKWVNMSATAVVLCLAFVPVASFGAIGDLLDSFPTPGPSPTGLTFHEGALWLTDWETGQLYEIDPQKGELLRQIDAPCYRPEGLASDGERLYVSDYETGKVYVLNTTSGLTETVYSGPADSPKGLAYGGGSLWLVDDGEDQIYELVPHDGTILNYYKAPHAYCRGLAHDGRYLWATDRMKDELYCVLPEDGEVLFLVKIEKPFPCGLAFGADAVWMVDFQEKMIHKLAAESDVPYRVTEEVTRDFRYTYLLRNDGGGVITTASIYLAVPYADLENQKLIGDITWTPEPNEFVADQWGQKVAAFNFKDVQPGASANASYETRVKLGVVHYAFDPDDVGGLSKIPKDLLKQNTAATSRLQLDKELVQKTAREIVGDEEHPYWMARKIYRWVRDALEYQRVGGWDVPTTLIKRGTGSCSEYAFLYIALCRAAGLPARYEGSVVVRGDDASIDDVYHRWCEVYLPGIGWMPVDPSGGDRDWPADQTRYFGGLSNRFIITTHGGGDSEYLGWTYNGNATYEYQGRADVHEEAYGVWSPVEED